MVLAGILVNSFANRNCDAFKNDVTATCQTAVDYIFFLGAAVGAGMALRGERIVIVGFLVAHFLGSTFFLVILGIPSYLGHIDPLVSYELSNRSLSVVFGSQFPFAFVTSFMGAILGTYLSEKLRL